MNKPLCKNRNKNKFGVCNATKVQISGSVHEKKKNMVMKNICTAHEIYRYK